MTKERKSRVIAERKVLQVKLTAGAKAGAARTSKAHLRKGNQSGMADGK